VVKKSNLAVRLMTALVAGPIILVLLFMGPAWGWYALVLAAALLASQELLAMTHGDDRISQGIAALGTAALSLAVYFAHSDSRVLLTGLLVVPILMGFAAVWRFADVEQGALRLTTNLAAPLYIGALLTTLALLRRDFESDGPKLVLLCLLIAWMGDTGGFFFGKYLGKTKLSPVISPKKTRAGLVGSCVFASLSAIAMQLTLLDRWVLWHMAILGAAGGVVGQLGDLMESLLKRSTGVKDSGRLIPGHGGILDRIDALLAVTPMVYLYALWRG
jgi:phosphatidate cytidylyltransferase